MKESPKITAATRMNDVTRKYPFTIKIFERYKVDLLFGGGHYSIGFTCRKGGVNVEPVLKAINDAIGDHKAYQRHPDLEMTFPIPPDPHHYPRQR